VPGTVQTNPDWSPDGKRLVFANAERTDGRENLWIADAEGDKRVRLVDCVAPCRWLDDPAWSPDGTRVLYSRMSEIDGVSFASLETVRVADGHIDVVLTAESNTFFAGQRWSPDGSKIVLEHVHKVDTPAEAEVDRVTLTIVDLATSPFMLTPITDPALWPATADWSPDGSEIVYSALPTPDSAAPDLFAVSVGTGVVRRLTSLSDTGGVAIHPDFTSDGTTILFVAFIAETGSFGLAAIDRAGGQIRPALGSQYVPGFHPRDRPVGRSACPASTC
jgi:Tol biopolymer transport system component